MEDVTAREECIRASDEFLGNLDKAVTRLKQVEPDSMELMELALSNYHNWHCRGSRYNKQNERIAVHFLLRRDYRMAWFIRNSSANWSTKREVKATRKYFAESEASKGIEECIAECRTNPEGVWWWHDTCFDVDPVLPEILQAKLDYLISDGYGGAPYDLSPTVRESKLANRGKYFVSHESMERLRSILLVLMKLQRHEDVAECLLRFSRIIEREPPKSLMEAPRLKHLTPQLPFWENWLASRLETDPVRKRGFGWTALTHLLRTVRVCAGTTHFGLEIMRPLCSIFYECGLWEDEADKQEYLRHFLFTCMHGGIETIRRLQTESIVPVRWADMGFPTMRECEVIYERIAAQAGK